jgi:hypothetical protein
MARTITLTFDENFPYGEIEKPVCDAIGYLSAWSYSSARMTSLNIYAGPDGCINAVYKNALGEVTYNIFALPDIKAKELVGYSFDS